MTQAAQGAPPPGPLELKSGPPPKDTGPALAGPALELNPGDSVPGHRGSPAAARAAVAARRGGAALPAPLPAALGAPFVAALGTGLAAARRPGALLARGAPAAPAPAVIAAARLAAAATHRRGDGRGRRRLPGAPKQEAPEPEKRSG